MDDAREFRTFEDVDETFAEAVVHKRRHKVLGYRLRPFSFWHAANLDFVESPFAGHKKPHDFAALYIAVKICRLRYPQVIHRGHFEHLVELWKARKFRFFNFTKNNSPFVIEVSKFSAYVRDYATRPEFLTSENGESAKCPWYLFEVALFKRHNPDLSWAQCWDMPIGEVSWFNAAMVEASGVKIEIVTPEYRKAFRAAGYKDD